MSPQQKALILFEKQSNFKVGSRSIPTPGTGQLLVKVYSAALNPVDYKIQVNGIFVTHYPAVLGVDIAGIVEELGEGVENFREGDKVGSVDYVIGYIPSQIPSSQSFDSAATVPLGVDTAVAGLYGKRLGAGITPPWAKIVNDHEPKKPIVILGGSSSVGSYTIQLARLSGFYPIITTASPSNEDLVKDYGATHFFDRHLSASQLMAAINKVTDSPIRIVYDAISLPETQSVGWGLLAQNGVLVLTLPALVKEDEGKGRKAVHTLGSPHLPHNQELFRSSWATIEKWLLEGIIQPNNHEILPNGLEGIIGGLERMRMEQVSGTKLVAHPQETK